MDKSAVNGLNGSASIRAKSAPNPSTDGLAPAEPDRGQSRIILIEDGAIALSREIAFTLPTVSCKPGLRAGGEPGSVQSAAAS